MARRPALHLAANRQGGQTLISLLIGVLISLITIAAMLVLYKTMIEVSANASRSALRDGQVSAALLAAQMELQSAGFGMPATASLEDRVVISDAGKRVVWRFLEGAQGRCAGLQVETHGISRLPAKDCNGLASVSWNANEQQPMARMPTNPDGSVFTLADEVGGMSLAAGYAFHLSGAPVNCLPYMQQSDAGSLPAGRTLDLKSGDGSSVLFSVCLPNLAVVNA